MEENNSQSFDGAVDQLIQKLRLPVEYAVIFKESVDLKLHREIILFGSNPDHSFEKIPSYIKEFLEKNINFIKRALQADIDQRTEGSFSDNPIVEQYPLFPSRLQIKTPLVRSKFYRFVAHFKKRGKNPDADI